MKLSDTDLSREWRAAVEEELLRGEQFRWCTRPIPCCLTSSSISQMLFGIPWTAITALVSGGFAMEMFSGKVALSMCIFSVFFFIPFWCIAVYMLSAPLRMRRSLERTLYVVTDRRALVMAPGWFGRRRTEVYPLEPDMVMKVRRKSDGSGDLVFETDDYRGQGRSIERGFLSVPRVREAEERLAACIEARKSSAG
ncbi:MAG: PH domain-containing protein [Akkermansia sp.]